jgi:hypothetical protein
MLPITHQRLLFCAVVAATIATLPGASAQQTARPEQGVVSVPGGARLPASPPSPLPVRDELVETARETASSVRVESPYSAEILQAVDEVLLPVALAAPPSASAPLRPQARIAFDSGRVTETMPAQGGTMRPDPMLLRTRLLEALRDDSLRSTPPAGIAPPRTSTQALLGGGAIPSVQVLRAQPRNAVAGLVDDLLRLDAARAEAAVSDPGAVNWWTGITWNKDISWGGHVAGGSTYTFTSTLSPDAHGYVFTRLVYTWRMSGNGALWPEVMDAAGTWFREHTVPDGGIAPADFSSSYINADGATSPTFDRMVRNFEAQNRVRTRVEMDVNVSRWEMEGDAGEYIAPAERDRNAYGAVDRGTNDRFRMIATGLPGWQHVGEAQRKSSGLVMDPNVVVGRVPSASNTGINGGDRVSIAVSGILQYWSNQGVFFPLRAPNSFRAQFVPADGSSPEILGAESFPRVFRKRGSLYYFLEKPTFSGSPGGRPAIHAADTSSTHGSTGQSTRTRTA